MEIIKKAPKGGFTKEDLKKSLKDNTDIVLELDKGKELYITGYMHKNGVLSDKASDDSVFAIDTDGKDYEIKLKDIIQIREGVEIFEGKVRIKRRYGDKSDIRTNENAPLRNSILREFGNNTVTEEQLMAILTKVSEDLGKTYNKKQWFRNNQRYFSKIQTESGSSWVLSKYGKRLYDSIQNYDRSIITEMKVIPSFVEFINENAINEGKYVELKKDWEGNDAGGNPVSIKKGSKLLKSKSKAYGGVTKGSDWLELGDILLYAEDVPKEYLK